MQKYKVMLFDCFEIVIAPLHQPTIYPLYPPNSPQNGAVSKQIIGSIENAPSGDGPMMILLDIPAGGKYYVHWEVTVAAVKHLIDSHKAGSLTMSQLL